MKIQWRWSIRRLLGLGLLTLTIIVGVTIAFTYGKVNTYTLGEVMFWSAGTKKNWEAGIQYKGINPHVGIANTKSRKELYFVVSVRYNKNKEDEGDVTAAMHVSFEHLRMSDMVPKPQEETVN